MMSASDPKSLTIRARIASGKLGRALDEGAQQRVQTWVDYIRSLSVAERKTVYDVVKTHVDRIGDDPDRDILQVQRLIEDLIEMGGRKAAYALNTNDLYSVRFALERADLIEGRTFPLVEHQPMVRFLMEVLEDHGFSADEVQYCLDAFDYKGNPSVIDYAIDAIASEDAERVVRLVAEKNAWGFLERRILDEKSKCPKQEAVSFEFRVCDAARAWVISKLKDEGGCLTTLLHTYGVILSRVDPGKVAISVNSLTAELTRRVPALWVQGAVYRWVDEAASVYLATSINNGAQHAAVRADKAIWDGIVCGTPHKEVLVDEYRYLCAEDAVDIGDSAINEIEKYRSERSIEAEESAWIGRQDFEALDVKLRIRDLANADIGRAKKIVDEFVATLKANPNTFKDCGALLGERLSVRSDTEVELAGEAIAERMAEILATTRGWSAVMAGQMICDQAASGGLSRTQIESLLNGLTGLSLVRDGEALRQASEQRRAQKMRLRLVGS